MYVHNVNDESFFWFVISTLIFFKSVYKTTDFTRLCLFSMFAPYSLLFPLTIIPPVPHFPECTYPSVFMTTPSHMHVHTELNLDSPCKSKLAVSLPLGACLVLLNMIISSSICLPMTEFSVVLVHHIFIHSSAEGWSAWFNTLVHINNLKAIWVCKCLEDADSIRSSELHWIGTV